MMCISRTWTSREYNRKPTHIVYLLRLYIYGRLYHYSIKTAAYMSKANPQARVSGAPAVASYSRYRTWPAKRRNTSAPRMAAQKL